ncbi:ABC transporter ATP-binding protein [Aureibacillus halotolerans]|uniref:ATP-binding cassette subfamily B protein n=1 Tax=Aureibacillus halotolerans TaxID=1508390 RepID=A0A4V3D651_9BACI|nr:ABC transporter ATP-binding protein [Aureibacillus halotolerans]TDQ42667.1 ATP-binding cassette subfamily B protein [Aureibacillus halotolerans]
MAKRIIEELKKPFQQPKPELDASQQTGGVTSVFGQGPHEKGISDKKKKPKDVKGTLARLWNYLAKTKNKLFLVVFMVFISSGLGLLGPVIVGFAIDDYITNREEQGFIWMLVSLGFVFAGQAAAMMIHNNTMIAIAQRTVYQLRTELFNKFHKLPIAYFDKRQHGELMSRVTNDIENVSNTLNTSFIQLCSSVLTLIGTVIVMLVLSPIMTAVTMTIIPAMYFGMKWITKRTSVRFKAQQRHLGEINGFIEETLSGQRVIKVFSQEERVLTEMTEKNNVLRIAGFWAQVYSGFIPKLMNFLNNASFALIAGVGGFLAYHNPEIVSIGVIVIFVEFSRQFTRPLNDLANQWNTLLSAVAGAERVFEVMDEDNEAKGETNAKAMDEVKGDVTFQHVTFSYEKEAGHIIHDVSFKAKAGETVAFVGPTGAGKTTMINLLARFYEVDDGDILLDDRPIESITRESLRSQLACVLQDTFLFTGTIRENIRYGRLNATDEEVVNAAISANAHDFISKLPQGYDTRISSEGGGISQGQKQLLSISRAILADPKLLILDEATSNIDTVTEITIQEALGRLMEGRTSFVIAHRLNTIRNADQIIVLQEGEITERGSHDELLAANGFYATLHHNALAGVSGYADQARA